MKAATAAPKADPAPIITFAINREQYVCFHRSHVISLIQELQMLLDDTIAVPSAIAEKAKAIPLSSRVRTASFSTASDTGCGDVAPAVVPANSSEPKPSKVRKPKAPHGYPNMRKLILPAKPPREGSFAEAVLATITEAGEQGLDVAGIVNALEAAEVSIESDDEQKAVANAIHQTLKPRGLIERCERTDHQTYWRRATA